MTNSDKREHVFIVGSPRSGTSLVASILQSSPVYAYYRAETKLLAGCDIKYGSLQRASVRRKFWGDWFRSRQFKRTGLSREEVLPIVDKQRSYISVLITVMNLVAEKQGKERWIDSTPENSARLVEISKSFPNAKVIHVIRDGRAVSLSLAKLGWSGVETKSFDNALYYSSLKWSCSVKNVIAASKYLKERYYEIRYEDLVQEPLVVISELCAFLQIPLMDKKFMQGGFDKSNEDARSTLHTPNTPFGDMASGISPNAAFRWKGVLTQEQVCKTEAHIGKVLDELGYPLLCNERQSIKYSIFPMLRGGLISTKNVLKKYTILGRYTVSPLEFEVD